MKNFKKPMQIWRSISKLNETYPSYLRAVQGRKFRGKIMGTSLVSIKTIDVKDYRVKGDGRDATHVHIHLSF